MKNVPQKANLIRKSIVRKLQNSISHIDTKPNLGALLKQYRTNLRLHFQNCRKKAAAKPNIHFQQKLIKQEQQDSIT